MNMHFVIPRILLGALYSRSLIATSSSRIILKNSHQHLATMSVKVFKR